MENNLQKCFDKFIRIAEYLAVGIAVVDQDGLVVYANQADCRFLGYPKEELVGMHFSAFTHPDDIQIDLNLFQELIEGKRQSYIIDKRYLRKDGSVVWGHLGVSMMVDPKSSHRYVIASCEDITERKVIEEALFRRESLLKAISDTAVDSIFCKDSDRRYTFVNRAMADLLGCSEADLLGKNPVEVFGPEAAEIIKEVDDLAFSGQKASEIRPLLINGEKYYFHTVQVPMEIKDGKVISINGIVRDVTESVLAQQKNTALEAEISQIHKMEALGTLTGGIAHDFNNILAIILGNAEMAEMYVADDHPARHHINQLVKASNRAKELIKRLLTFSRQEKGEKIPSSLFTLAGECLETIHSTIPKTVRLEVRIPKKYRNNPGNSSIFNADRTQIHQLLLNLCINAFQAMDEEGTLQVAVDEVHFSENIPADRPGLKPGTYAYLSVSDTGHGVSPDLIDRIFDPFFTTKEVDQGTGIGLSVVQGIVKNHDGLIYVESKLKKGTTFHIYFPVTSKKNQDKGKAEPKKDMPLPQGDERILFVDDEIMITEVGKAILEQLGYSVTTCISGAEALEKFRDAPDEFDLVITDQVMPNMPGSELAGKMLQIRGDIPIILCTGHSSKIDRDRATQIGIREFVYKPLEKRDVAQLVRQVLDGKD